MNVFISWSGVRSHAVAAVLRDWVMAVIQAAKPWISSEDIERGAGWMGDINQRLQDSTVGIFCLTEENQNAPWILFEAGAVAKGVPGSRICTLLIDLEPASVHGPLAQFNHTRPSHDDMYKLVKTLNHALGNSRLEDLQLKRAFDAHWPAFEAGFANALAVNPKHAPATPTPDSDDVLAEILTTVRGLSKRISRLEMPTVDGKKRVYELSRLPSEGTVANEHRRESATSKAAVERLFDALDEVSDDDRERVLHFYQHGIGRTPSQGMR